MQAGTYNFTIKQGTKFSRTLTWTAGGTPVDITGYTAELRAVTQNDETSIITLSTTPDADGNGITLGGTAGTITILMKTAATDAMDFTNGKYNLDLADADSEVVLRLDGAISFERKV